jgi:protein SCO1/2
MTVTKWKFLCSVRFGLALQLVLLPLATPEYASSHDQRSAQTANAFERREIQRPVADFALTNQAARPFKFSSLRGKVALVAFAYTTCPDLCPLVTAAMRQVQDGLKPEERSATYFLTITTDPEIDTPVVLAAYAKRHGVNLTNWSFLTGEQAALERVWKNFGVVVRRQARGLIDHTMLTAVVDHQGTVRIVYLGSAPNAETMRRDIRELIQAR